MDAVGIKYPGSREWGSIWGGIVDLPLLFLGMEGTCRRMKPMTFPHRCLHSLIRWQLTGEQHLPVVIPFRSHSQTKRKPQKPQTAT